MDTHTHTHPHVRVHVSTQRDAHTLTCVPVLIHTDTRPQSHNTERDGTVSICREREQSEGNFSNRHLKLSLRLFLLDKGQGANHQSPACVFPGSSHHMRSSAFLDHPSQEPWDLQTIQVMTIIYFFTQGGEKKIIWTQTRIMKLECSKY